MPVPLVFARPERLRRFRVTARALAEGLDLRRAVLAGAVERYEAGTERAYEVDCDPALAALRGLALAVQDLGEWVGRVGDAFEHLPVLGGVRVGPVPVLLAALPPGLRFDGAAGDGEGGPGGDGGREPSLAGAGLALLGAAATGAHPRDLRAMAAIVGPDGSAGRALQAAAASRPATVAGRALDTVQAVADGTREGWHRWRAEPHRETVDRAGRAIVDGGLRAAGSYGAAAAGAAAGGYLCSSSVVAAPVCASIGARVVGGAGAAAAEHVSDWLLGDEPASWERDPAALTEEVADADDDAVDAVGSVLDRVADQAQDAADRHADFVVDHPWLWDDEYVGAPSHEPPPPAPDVPARGPS